MLIIINNPILYYKHKDGKYTFRLGFPAKKKNRFAKKRGKTRKFKFKI